MTLGTALWAQSTNENLWKGFTIIWIQRISKILSQLTNWIDSHRTGQNRAKAIHFHKSCVTFPRLELFFSSFHWSRHLIGLSTEVVPAPTTSNDHHHWCYHAFTITEWPRSSSDTGTCVITTADSSNKISANWIVIELFADVLRCRSGHNVNHSIATQRASHDHDY